MTEARATLGPLFWIGSGFRGWELGSAGTDIFESRRNRVTMSARLLHIVEVFVERSFSAVEGSPLEHPTKSARTASSGQTPPPRASRAAPHGPLARGAPGGRGGGGDVHAVFPGAAEDPGGVAR